MEECQELRLDLEDVKEMYKIQVGKMSRSVGKCWRVVTAGVVTDRRAADKIENRMTKNVNECCVS